MFKLVCAIIILRKYFFWRNLLGEKKRITAECGHWCESKITPAQHKLLCMHVHCSPGKEYPNAATSSVHDRWSMKWIQFSALKTEYAECKFCPNKLLHILKLISEVLFVKLLWADKVLQNLALYLKCMKCKLYLISLYGCQILYCYC